MVTQGGLPYPDGMVLYVARHGQTDWNLRGRWQSRSDVPLNATGRGQAEALKRTLQRQQVDALNQTNNRWAVAFTPVEDVLKLI